MRVLASIPGDDRADARKKLSCFRAMFDALPAKTGPAGGAYPIGAA
jgi:hypothetical protein